MFGIVIWVDHHAKRGIVWCEDQKELAVIDAHSLSKTDPQNLELGDQFMFQEKWIMGIRQVASIEQYFSKNAAIATGQAANIMQTARRQNTAPLLRVV